MTKIRAKKTSKAVVAKDLGDSIMDLAAAGVDIQDVRPAVLSCDPNGPRGPGGAIHLGNTTAITQEMREQHPKLFSEIDKAWAEHQGSPITPQQKAAEIEAAWALHEGKPVSLSAELRHVVVKTVGNSRFNAAGEKVIFASADEIDQCARVLRERNKSFRLAKGQEQVKASIPVLADHKYHNLADLKNQVWR